MAKSDYNKPAREGWSRKYEEAYKKLKKKCINCDGKGMVAGGQCDDYCPKCDGKGYIDKC